MATQLQIKAIKRIVEKQGKVAISRVMREVGYNPHTAKNPKNLTESEAWKELMDRYLPDKLLAKKHKELLTTPKIKRQFQKEELLSETEELDSQAISRGLDMGYKLKGKYAPERHDVRQLVIEISKEIADKNNLVNVPSSNPNTSSKGQASV